MTIAVLSMADVLEEWEGEWESGRWMREIRSKADCGNESGVDKSEVKKIMGNENVSEER
jgi:hypothetical protein